MTHNHHPAFSLQFQVPMVVILIHQPMYLQIQIVNTWALHFLVIFHCNIRCTLLTDKSFPNVLCYLRILILVTCNGPDVIIAIPFHKSPDVVFAQIAGLFHLLCQYQSSEKPGSPGNSWQITTYLGYYFITHQVITHVSMPTLQTTSWISPV